MAGVVGLLVRRAARLKVVFYRVAVSVLVVDDLSFLKLLVRRAFE